MFKKIRNIVLSLMVLTVLGAGSVWAYMDSRQDRIDEHMARVKAAQEATASISIPTPSPEPTPTAPSVPKTTPKSASNIQTEPTAECSDIDGSTIILPVSKCYELQQLKQEMNQALEQAAQRPHYSDYYVPTYNYETPDYSYNPPPTFTYDPIERTDYSNTFNTGSYPTLGESYNPNEFCETRSTNAGSITVCR